MSTVLPRTKLHKTRVTPAMAAGVTKTMWSVGDLVATALYGEVAR